MTPFVQPSRLWLFSANRGQVYDYPSTVFDHCWPFFAKPGDTPLYRSTNVPGGDRNGLTVAKDSSFVSFSPFPGFPPTVLQVAACWDGKHAWWVQRFGGVFELYRSDEMFLQSTPTLVATIPAPPPLSPSDPDPEFEVHALVNVRGYGLALLGRETATFAQGGRGYYLQYFDYEGAMIDGPVFFPLNELEEISDRYVTWIPLHVCGCNRYVPEEIEGYRNPARVFVSCYYEKRVLQDESSQVLERGHLVLADSALRRQGGTLRETEVAVIEGWTASARVYYAHPFYDGTRDRLLVPRLRVTGDFSAGANNAGGRRSSYSVSAEIVRQIRRANGSPGDEDYNQWNINNVGYLSLWTPGTPTRVYQTTPDVGSLVTRPSGRAFLAWVDESTGRFYVWRRPALAWNSRPGNADVGVWGIPIEKATEAQTVSLAQMDKIGEDLLGQFVHDFVDHWLGYDDVTGLAQAGTVSLGPGMVARWQM